MRNRNQFMSEWDDVRQRIADGCHNSGPRDWFEGVLDDQDQRIVELESVLRVIADDTREADGDLVLEEIHRRARAALKT